MPRIRSRRRAGILAAASAALTIAAIASPVALWPSAARASASASPAVSASAAVPASAAAPSATATVGIDAPAGATSAWIEFEQSGLAPASLEVAARLDDGPWRDVALTGTTFGLHGELPIASGRLEVSVVPAPGFAASTPDVALTVLDGSGAALASTSERLTVPARGLPGGTSDPAAVSVVPADGQPSTTGARGGLAATGAPDVLAPLTLAVAAMLAGAAALALRFGRGLGLGLGLGRHRRRPTLREKAGA